MPNGDLRSFLKALVIRSVPQETYISLYTLDIYLLYSVLQWWWPDEYFESVPEVWSWDCCWDGLPGKEVICSQRPCSQEHTTGWAHVLQGTPFAAGSTVCHMISTFDGSDWWLWHGSWSDGRYLLQVQWRQDSSEVDCTWGSALQEILHSQWCVELWDGHVWDLVRWKETIPTSQQQWCDSTSPEPSVSPSPSWLPERSLQTDGGVLVSSWVRHICNWIDLNLTLGVQRKRRNSWVFFCFLARSHMTDSLFSCFTATRKEMGSRGCTFRGPSGHSIYLLRCFPPQCVVCGDTPSTTGVPQATI